jgi:hypothetical protein
MNQSTIERRRRFAWAPQYQIPVAADDDLPPGVAAFAAGRSRQSGQALCWINRAPGGLFVYLGARVTMLQAR